MKYKEFQGPLDELFGQDSFVSLEEMERRMMQREKDKPIKEPARRELDLNSGQPKQFTRTIEIKGRKFEVSASAPITDELVQLMVEHYREAGTFDKPQVFQFDDNYEDGDLPFNYSPLGSPKMTQHMMFRGNEVQLEQVGDKLEVKISYNLAFISAIKGLPKSTRYFDPKRKLWIVSVSQLTSLEALLKAAGADFKRFKPKSFDLYEVLGVLATATQDEIKKSFYRLSRTCHPDVCQDFNAREKFEFLKGAYDVLRNPQQRKKYDFARNLKTT